MDRERKLDGELDKVDLSRSSGGGGDLDRFEFRMVCELLVLLLLLLLAERDFDERSEEVERVKDSRWGQ